MTKKHVTKWGLGAMTLLAMIIASTGATDPETNPGKVIKENPIVINTIAQHYENPTLGEYQLCTKSRDDCIKECEFRDETCRSRCPICPILIDQDALVQGINDTLYRLPITSGKVNQTNIIRLTNEIRNIIENSLGNITTNNQNNINVYQNRSRTGGRFGLGYTEKGPCCNVIESQRCQRSITGPKCSHRRQRTCGPQCISRVVRAKPVVTCSQTNPDECTESFEYEARPVPPGCQYSQTYPFINCNSATQHSPVSRRINCDACHNLPYVRVMRGQVPNGCQSCYGQRNRKPVYRQSVYPQVPVYYGAPMQLPYPNYYSQIQPNFYPNFRNDWVAKNDEDYETIQFELSRPDNGYKVDAQKCVNEDGSVLENCPQNVDELEDIGTNTDEAFYETNEAADEDTYYQDEMLPQTRRRFRRRTNKN